ncbi:phage tail assembly chaperone G [Enterococcus lactis]|uniref:phage tail assembly chaperone G n=1 Tax=Enterococcus lactis TaxID=357441 RepID=UPI0039A78794
MAQVRIELKNKKGKKEVFEKLETTGKDYRLALQTIKKLNAEKIMVWDQLDIYLAFAVEIFKADKLTSDQILDGLPSEKTRETLDGLLGQVMGIESDPDPEAKK